MTRLYHRPAPLVIAFLSLGCLGVIGGGAIAAFGAHAPSQLLMWLSAYLVLVIGAVQIALGIGLWLYANTQPARSLVVILALFNASNALVITGRVLARPDDVVVGAIGITLAAINIALITISRPFTLWKSLFLSLLIVLVGSAIVGVVLSFS